MSQILILKCLLFLPAHLRIFVLIYKYLSFLLQAHETPFRNQTIRLHGESINFANTVFKTYLFIQPQTITSEIHIFGTVHFENLFDDLVLLRYQFEFCGELSLAFEAWVWLTLLTTRCVVGDSYRDTTWRSTWWLTVSSLEKDIFTFPTSILGQNKPHKCGECESSFSEGSQLRNHLVKHHNQVSQPVCATSVLLPDPRMSFFSVLPALRVPFQFCVT